MTLDVAVLPPQMSVEIKVPNLDAATGTPVVREYVERDPYEGPYRVIPGPEPTILATKTLRMTDDVTIDAIPQCYGLITWNGSTLTVS